MNGTEMLMGQFLKMIGLTPDKIAEFSTMAQGMGAAFADMRERQQRIEEKLDRLIEYHMPPVPTPMIDLTPERKPNGTDQ